MRAPEKPAASSTDTDDRYRVRSLDRALDLLEALAQGGRAGASLSELSRRAGMSKSNAFSILHTLIARGYAADEGEGMTRRYRLSRTLARLAEGAFASDSVTTVGQKVLESLTARTGLTSRLAVLDDGYVVALLRVDGPGPVQLSTYLGKRELPHCSGVGKAILASLPQTEVDAILRRIGLPRRTPQTITSAAALKRQLAIVRERGYSFDDEEDHEGVFCVGAAFFGRDGAPAGAISVSGLKPGRTETDLHRLGAIVREHAAAVSRQLGSGPPVPTSSAAPRPGEP
jgi:IclR family acetate operon transcriptional repressor